jgi:hypothetical protein
MKKIKYQMLQTVVLDGVELPKSEEYMASITIPYSEENEEIAKKEAYNGEYTIEDDGMPDPVADPTTDEILDAMLGVM